MRAGVAIGSLMSHVGAFVIVDFGPAAGRVLAGRC